MSILRRLLGPDGDRVQCTGAWLVIAGVAIIAAGGGGRLTDVIGALIALFGALLIVLVSPFAWIDAILNLFRT